MKKTLLANIILTFILIVWGSVVRNTGAGLACPDWPLCHGQVIPPLEPLILLEWGHRLLASSVGFLSLGIFIRVLLKADYRTKLGLLSAISIVLLIVQILLGAITVAEELKPQFVTIHLGVALIFLTVILLMWLCLRHPEVVIAAYAGIQSSLFFIIIGCTFLVYLQILLGGWVAATHAGLACPDFPKCLGYWVPPLEGLVKYHFFHRVVAFLVFIAIFFLYIACRVIARGEASWQSQSLNHALKAILIAVILQMGLGISNVLFKLPLIVSVAHTAMAVSIFAMLVVMAYNTSKS